MRKIAVAIDGFSSCGKSTMAKELARDASYIYVDTGAMYRAVALFAMSKGLFDSYDNIDIVGLENQMDGITIEFRLNSETKRPDTYLNNVCVEEEIRSLEVSKRVSKIAALPFVRARMVAIQRDMGKEKGIVMDGRDIGTVVLPDAELKIFVTASDEIRARRRFDELTAKGIPADYNDILNNVRERDYMDTHREVSPLRKADDAVIFDNSNMTLSEQKQWLWSIFLQKTT